MATHQTPALFSVYPKASLSAQVQIHALTIRYDSLLTPIILGLKIAIQLEQRITNRLSDITSSCRYDIIGYKLI